MKFPSFASLRLCVMGFLPKSKADQLVRLRRERDGRLENETRREIMKKMQPRMKREL